MVDKDFFDDSIWKDFLISYIAGFVGCDKGSTRFGDIRFFVEHNVIVKSCNVLSCIHCKDGVCVQEYNCSFARYKIKKEE